MSQSKKAKKSDIKAVNEEEIFVLSNEEVPVPLKFRIVKHIKLCATNLQYNKHSGFKYGEPVLSNTVKSKIKLYINTESFFSFCLNFLS